MRACTITLGCLNVGLNCTLVYEYACLYVCMPNIYFNLELDQTTLCVPVIDFANAPNPAKFSLHWSTSLIFILYLVQFDFVLVLNVAKEEWEVIVLQTLNGLFVDIGSKETKGHVHYVTEILYKINVTFLLTVHYIKKEEIILFIISINLYHEQRMTNLSG